MKTIKEIPSLIGTLQSNKILQKMKERKDNGEFRSEQEFNDALRVELISIAQAESQPTFNFIPIVSGPAYSDYINLAMSQLSLDLEVVFSELNYIFSKITSHQSFFNKTSKEIQSLINKLDRELEAVEIEAALDTAFNKVYYNSFLDKSKVLSMQNNLSAEFYYDDRLNQKFNITESGDVNVETGDLSLPKFSDDDIDIASVNIVSTETTVSDFDIQIPGITSQNLVTTDENSIWSYNVLTRKKVKEAVLALDVDLGDKKEINRLMIVPNAAIPAILESISYINSNGEEIDLGVESQSLSESKIFNFPTVIIRRLKIRMLQDKTKIIPYDLNSNGVTLEDLQRNPNLPVTISSITGNVSQQINDPNIQNILGLGQNQIQNQILLNNYEFSLSSIQVGLSDFKTKGVYVSKPAMILKPSMVAFEAADFIGTVRDIQTQLEMPSASIEYTLFKKDFSLDNILLGTKVFPVLPLGKEIINNERLFFNKDKIQTLRFLGHKTDGDGSSVIVYRNGEELIRGIDWRFSERQTPANPSDNFIKISAFSTKIEITHTDEQILNGVYYSEYSPRYRLEPEETVFDKGIRYLDSGATLHSLEYLGEEISYSNMYLRIIIRNHTDSGVSSPRIDFYRVLAKEELDE